VSLSTKLTLALALTALLLVGGVGWWQLAAEERDLETAVEHDVRLLGRTLQVSFENALRDRQAEDVQETLGELEAIDPEVDVLVYDAAGSRLAASHGARESSRWLAARPEHTELRFVSAPEPGYVELLVPLRITRDARAATLVLVRPLDDMRADLRATRVRAAWSVLGFVLVVALLTHLLARYWVGAPLALMVEHIRRVRSGDLASTPLGARDDEVGATLKQFEALVVELREARERIERDAESRAQLDRQLRDLDKMRAVGTLAAGIAHEIGSPLQILEGRLATLDQRAEDAREVRRLTSILLDQVRRITRIVSGFLDVARHRSNASVTAVGTEAPVRAVVALLESEARRRQVEIKLRAAPCPLARGDGDTLQQLTLNLVRNALEACRAGDRVEITIEPSTMDAAAGRSPAVLLRVVDSGRGMAPEIAARAFDPFFTTRAHEGGTGLGLAVVKSIVDELEGSIEVASRSGEGSTFSVRLPVARGAAET
jgi:signal transduction histidine kinase